MPDQKGVFCLEGVWERNLKANPSVEPLLDLLDQVGTSRRTHIYRDVGTVEEFDHYLSVWVQSRYKTHPILYLAFHGVEGGLCVGDLRKPTGIVTLERIEKILAGRCHGKVIHFGACETLKLHGLRINHFLRDTGAAAVCGYMKKVPWTVSAAFDLLLFQQLQANAFIAKGLLAVERKLMKQAGVLARSLAFRMRVNTGI